ncbi:5-bromo-4-chloroindolyl phosphate hydrolysis family protein [Weissella confusa]|uniref:5-bromo-4-chloroindolyl phosphate hydrolysis family protein n=1 Tax=Weissella confusa TaxID=1583 RepID=UPI0018F1CEC6|nr:5-bromo-4-chloroindolyl phosphate hydrolysis family protein [Weissella confusa]MBJ7617704.1 5-bromo-4-chloroindolyl phosphate hydrolase [Weissella confusa]MBJ7650714.1 5-bromo-4-chloroindolyl phosphate hydrolase [Weissella confusa]MBJ7657706.1 5-bromo-4-chloroindolyl phosphate hydrolase [Weissella confusa]MBJ7664632.1 5-bromo-4-chloroindolyl phosphate hydrolase [Weissella confusa]
MLDLDKIPKKILRRSKWLTVLMLFLAIGFTPAYLDSISNVLVFAFLVSLVTKPTFVFRWLLPLMLIGVAWAIPGIGWPVQLLLSGVVLGVRQVVFTPMKQTKQRITTAKQKLTINTDNLSKRDVTVFKATFNRTLAGVDHVEELLQLTTGLRRIAIETDVMRFARGILKELADDPTQLTEADEFVYTHLPNMEQILVTYQEIANHEMIDESDKAHLKAAREVLRQLADQIQQDYRLITRDDLNSLRDQIDVAKRTMGDKK